MRGKVLVAEGSYRDEFCEKLPESLSATDRASAAGSEMDPPLAKAEPINDGANTSGITQLRSRGRK